ncbi:MAG: prepilin-type N-terminal cleavage/methylation domain-containing protein [Deltaproteobacteria bacterium]|nr:prepilin-type N-terminal cleavage/methylation domain-containing protein [Deltaproteobacteria bacterium]
MINNAKSVKGFTLIEILFALFIGLLLMGTVYVSMISGQKSSAALEDKVVAQQDTRAVLELMALEIGMASYNPNFVPNIWRNPGDCTSESGNRTYKGIQWADANSITVQMDIPHTTSLGALRPESGFIALADPNTDDRPNENIAYVYDIANQRITRSTNCGSAQSFLGDAIGNPRSVRVINNTLIPNIPMFRYFNGMGVEIPAASLPAGIPNIRRIEITLAVETEDIDPNSMGRRRMIYSTSVIPRNHAINL